MSFTIISSFIPAMSGAVEHGTQYQMTMAYEHKLQRTAYNFCFGPFGQVKGKKLSISCARCLVSMDVMGLRDYYFVE